MKLHTLVLPALAATAGLAAPALAQTLPTAATRLKGIATGQCIDVAGGSIDVSARIEQYACHDGPNQKWTFQPVSGGYRIVAQHSGQCMDVDGGSTEDGALISQYTCHSGPNQVWVPTWTGSAWRLASLNSGKCLAVPGSSTVSGTQLVQWNCSGLAGNALWTVDGAAPPVGASAGLWSSVINLPLIPISASMLGNGKLMLWSASGTNSFGAGGRHYTTVFDPATNTAGGLVLVSNTGYESFCEGTALLADGSVMMTGGPNPKISNVLSPSGTWSQGASLNIGRGYAGQTLTSKGQVFTLGGSWSGGTGGKTGELYTPGGGWTLLTGVSPNDFLTADTGGVYRADNHMWLFGQDNGWVFHAGPSKKMHWVNTAGTGSVTAAGLRGSDGDAMNGNAVMYEPGKILTLGGAPNYTATTPRANAFVIDLTAGPGVTPTVRQTGSMNHARAYSSAVVLPNGQVVVIGGQERNATAFQDNDSVYAAEIWDPATNVFKKLATMRTPRNYHSVALLMADGRILAGGGGGSGGTSTDHPNAEIFTPPYLLNNDGTPATRPTLSAAPASATPGSRITVTSTGATSYVLVRMSSVTHTVNNDQRRVPLTVTSSTSSGATLQIPASTGTVLPGNYMLFAMAANGVPSVAKLINIR